MSNGYKVKELGNYELQPPIKDIYNWSKADMLKRANNYFKAYEEKGFATGDAGGNLNAEQLYMFALERMVYHLMKEREVHDD